MCVLPPVTAAEELLAGTESTAIALKREGVRPAGKRRRKPFGCKHVLPFMNKRRMAQIQEPKRDMENYSRNDHHLPDCISELPWTSASCVPPISLFFEQEHLQRWSCAHPACSAQGTGDVSSSFHLQMKTNCIWTHLEACSHPDPIQRVTLWAWG